MVKYRNGTPTSAAILTLVAAFCCMSAAAYADGKFFPAHAEKLIPEIPRQRAILTHRDGVETLVIESSLQGMGTEFAWIIPLPARPTSFEKTTPGLIKTLSLTLQPEITHAQPQQLMSLLVLAFVLTVAYLCAWLKTSKTRQSWAILTLCLLIVGGFFAMPHMGTARMQAAGRGSSTGANLVDTRRIGSYDLAVIEAENPQVLDQWLTANGYAGLDEADHTIVADYIADNWCFVAAKLTRTADGLSRPHPLAMTFPSKEMIYPMRLTATAGSDLYLELFVIADTAAKSPLLETELCDRYSHSPQFPAPKTDTRPTDDKTVTVLCAQNHYDIEHPGAFEYIRHNSILTKLTATLTPAQMQKDLKLEPADYKPTIKHYFSTAGARDVAIVLALFMWCVVPSLGTILGWSSFAKPGGRKLYLTRLLAPSAAICLLPAALFYVSVDRIPVRTRPWVATILSRAWRPAQFALDFASEYDNFKGMTQDRATELFAEYLAVRAIPNPFTGERVTVEDSPGNIEISVDPNGPTFRSYGQYGARRTLTESELAGIREYPALLKNMTQTLCDPFKEPSPLLWTDIATTADLSVIRIGDTVIIRRFMFEPMMAALFRRCPADAVPRVLEQLETALRENRTDECYGRIHILSEMLGCITGIAPPLDALDDEKMNAFLSEVRNWSGADAEADSADPAIDNPQ